MKESNKPREVGKYWYGKIKVGMKIEGTKNWYDIQKNQRWKTSTRTTYARGSIGKSY